MGGLRFFCQKCKKLNLEHQSPVIGQHLVHQLRTAGRLGSGRTRAGCSMFYILSKIGPCKKLAKRERKREGESRRKKNQKKQKRCQKRF